MYKVLIYTALSVFLWPSHLFAQDDDKIKWGKIAPADLEMSVYEKDSQAAAVILADVGFIVVNIRSGFDYRFRHHRRIKILKESAYDEATISLPFYTGRDPEKITNLKAQIFLPSGERITVPRKDIFEEKITPEWSVRKFTFPNLQKGAIIEYRYDLLSKRIVELQPWNFQHDLPVRYSQLVVEIPRWLDYVYLFNGIKDKAKKVAENALVVVEGNDEKQQPLEGDARVEIEKNSFVMRHVPAIQKEPFMTTVDDYRASIRFQLNKINQPDGVQETFLSSWEETAYRLMKHEHFGQQFTKKKHFKKLVDATEKGLAKAKTDWEKAEYLGKYLSQNIEWNGQYGMFVDKTLNDAFTKKVAESSTINMMLLAMLRYAGLEAEPVLISTRGHGKMIQQYPIVDQFNHMLVMAKLDNQKWLFDITDPIRPLGYPAIESLNSYGWIVRTDNPEWIALEAPSGSDSFMVRCRLEEDGRLSGQMQGTYMGYNAIGEREKYMEQKDGLHWQQRIGAEVNIDSVSIENLNLPEKKFKEKFHFDIENAAMQAGSMIYIKPVFYSNFDEQMFRLEDRDFPVDIPYPFKEKFVIKMQIPAGYEVEALPESTRVMIVNNGGEFNFLCDQKGDYVQLISKIQIHQLRYQPEEYDNIKEFFERITEKLGEQVVLRKTEG